MRTAQEQDVMDTDKNMNNSYNDRIEKKRFWQQVKAMLHKLSAMERQVFTLRFMDHRNINEIAVILDRNESTIKTYLYRALGKVRGNAEFFKEYREAL
jgi:RNA polymerase sigma factor (sigma-70 family)